MFSNDLGVGSQFLIFTCLFFSCARPNYQNGVPPASESETAQTQSFSDCDLDFPQTLQSAKLRWNKIPNDSEMGLLTLTFSADLTQDPRVVLWMPSMGHGSRPTKVTRLSSSLFQVSNVAFIMPGEWEIRIRLLENNQVIDEVVRKITY